VWESVVSTGDLVSDDTSHTIRRLKEYSRISLGLFSNIVLVGKAAEYEQRGGLSGPCIHLDGSHNSLSPSQRSLQKGSGYGKCLLYGT